MAYVPANPATGALNPNAQYVVAQFGTVATSSRNTLMTPPIDNIDLTVAKHISITERYKVDFMAAGV